MNCTIKEIIKRVKNKVSIDESPLKYYVAGEHFENNEFTIKRFGNIEGSTIGPAFHMHFKPGHVLLMSRNPHLRKAGMVNFEGICSDVSYVCETKDNNIFLQDLLPFLFQSDNFWIQAEQKKRGSTNFFLNWSDFEEIEVEIPDQNNQQKLAKVLWAAENTRQTYKNMLIQLDKLIQAKFIEMFGDCEQTELNQIISLEYGKALKSEDRIQSGDIPVYGSNGIVGYHNTSLVNEATIIVGRKGSCGNLCITEGPCYPIDTCFYVKQRQAINLKFLFFALKRINLNDLKKDAVIPGINRNDYLNNLIPISTLKEQNQFADFVLQVEKSKDELQKSLDNLNIMTKALINENLK